MQTSLSNDGRVFVDHYSALGLSIEASDDQVKKHFRLMAKKYHPDRGGDGLKFLDIYNAYQVLIDHQSRNTYNARYLAFIRSAGLPETKRSKAIDAEVIRLEIPPARLIYPGNVATLARRGLLRRKFSGRDRRIILNIDYDVELPLSEKEFSSPLLVRIPLIARTLCPECRGSNIHCQCCNGRGSGKRTRLIRLNLDGGLLPGQVLELQLSRLRMEPLSHFKKKHLRIKISRLRRRAMSASGS